MEGERDENQERQGIRQGRERGGVTKEDGWWRKAEKQAAGWLAGGVTSGRGGYQSGR